VEILDGVRLADADLSALWAESYANIRDLLGMFNYVKASEEIKRFLTVLKEEA
jgi:hypothetical protein